MTIPNVFSTDPLTTSWLFTIAALLIVFVVTPLIRAALAALLYAIAAVTGRQALRGAAARMMPRIGHLIGGIVIGTAAVAAPAMAASEPHGSLAAIDLDRDAGASRTAAAVETHPTSRATTPAAPVASTTAPAVEPAATPRQATTAPMTIDQPYVVRTGDTLWDIAAEHLDDATNAEITDAWKAIWRANIAVIGDEPGLIHPGQQLNLGALA